MGKILCFIMFSSPMAACEDVCLDEMTIIENEIKCLRDIVDTMDYVHYLLYIHVKDSLRIIEENLEKIKTSN